MADTFTTSNCLAAFLKMLVTCLLNVSELSISMPRRTTESLPAEQSEVTMMGEL